VHLHEEFGASLGDLVLYAGRRNGYQHEICGEIGTIKREHFEHLEAHGSYKFIFTFITEPSSDDLSIPVTRIASRCVLEVLRGRRMWHWVQSLARIYNLFNGDPATAAATGWIFEPRIRHLFQRRRKIQLYRIRGRHAEMNLTYDDYTASAERDKVMDLRLSQSERHDVIETAQFQEGQYYRSLSDNFPGDLLLLQTSKEQPIFLAFKILHAAHEHEANVNGLRTIDVMEFAPDTRRYHVVLTPENVELRITDILSESVV
jgi:hypothetical protein